MLTECCDVIVAHSPPLFTAHNAQPELSVLYQNFRLVMNQKQQSPLSVRRFNTRSSGSPTREIRQVAPAKPRRPCLVIRADSDGSIGSSSGSSSDENEPSSPVRRKKKVVFADDRGLSLTQVRMMNEPSNQPPNLMTVSPYLNQPSVATPSSSAGGATAGVLSACIVSAVGAVPVNYSEQQQQQQQQQVQQQWHLRFSQPASNYLDFRKRLDNGNISLENVIVKTSDNWIFGTVKVRNLSYDKDVFVRSTRNNWATHCDTVCAYVQNNAMMNGNGSCSTQSGPMQNVMAIYDTFSFRLQMPTDAAAMAFAVCYKGDGFECWDNNDGNNYCLSIGGLPANPLLLQHSATVLPLSLAAIPAADFDHHLTKQSPVHYFGDQSKENSWTSWREQKHNDVSTYW